MADEYYDGEGVGEMKEKELREIATCALCGKRIGDSGLPLFWRVRIRRYGLKADAMRRQQGLGMMIGGQLAQVMGPDEDLAEKISETEITVCETCATKPELTCVAVLAERGEKG